MIGAQALQLLCLQLLSVDVRLVLSTEVGSSAAWLLAELAELAHGVLDVHGRRGQLVVGQLVGGLSGQCTRSQSLLHQELLLLLGLVAGLESRVLRDNLVLSLQLHGQLLLLTLGDGFLLLLG